MNAFQEIQGSQAPSPSGSDLRSFSAIQRWDAQVYGFRLPDSEFHQKWDSSSDGRVKNPRDFPGSEYLMKIILSTKYSKIPVPALAIFVIPHVPDTWITESTYPSVAKQLKLISQVSIVWQKGRQRRLKMAFLARV